MSLFIPSLVTWNDTIPIIDGQQPNGMNDWKMDTPQAKRRHELARYVYDMWSSAYQYDHTFNPLWRGVPFNTKSKTNNGKVNGKGEIGHNREVIWRMSRYYYNGMDVCQVNHKRGLELMKLASDLGHHEARALYHWHCDQDHEILDASLRKEMMNDCYGQWYIAMNYYRYSLHDHPLFDDERHDMETKRQQMIDLCTPELFRRAYHYGDHSAMMMLAELFRRRLTSPTMMNKPEYVKDGWSQGQTTRQWLQCVARHGDAIAIDNLQGIPLRNSFPPPYGRDGEIWDDDQYESLIGWGYRSLPMCSIECAHHLCTILFHTIDSARTILTSNPSGASSPSTTTTTATTPAAVASASNAMNRAVAHLNRVSNTREAAIIMMNDESLRDYIHRQFKAKGIPLQLPGS